MIRILLADDHKQVRKALRAALEDYREWEVCGEACDGRQAVELALALKPDVAVLDFAMPELNGIEATRQIKKVQPEIEILIFTFYDSEEMTLRAREAGARGSVPKSADEFGIVNAIRVIQREKSFV